MAKTPSIGEISTPPSFVAAREEEEDTSTLVFDDPPVSMPSVTSERIAPTSKPPGRGVRAGDTLAPLLAEHPRYEDLGPLGEGGMAEVRRVRDRALGCAVALKAIRADLALDQRAVDRFIAEAQITSQLQHPGIPPVHDLGRLPGGRAYFTMRVVEGRTLREVIRETHFAGEGRAAWTLRRLVEAFRKVCETVAFAHDRGVLHRDLKPGNVMVGDFGEVLVVDWGLADRRGANDVALSPRAGAMPGTPWYMPPEVARGEAGAVGPTADVYALGAILYETLCGRPPYSGLPRGRATTIGTGAEDPGGLLDVIRAGPPPPPREVLSTRASGAGLSEAALPVALEAICLRAMAREPRQRFHDAGSLAAEVGAWLEGARKREQAMARVAEADRLLRDLNARRAEAGRLRARAVALSATLRPHQPVAEKQLVWSLEDEASQLDREIRASEVSYLQTLWSALSHVPELAEAHDRLADHYRDRLERAEARGYERGAATAGQLLRAHDRGRYAAWRRGVGAITLHTDPPGAEALLYRYATRQRRLVPELARALGSTPLIDVPVAMGSWLLVLRAPDRAPVSYPFQIGRCERWSGAPPGATEPLPIALPLASETGPHDVYVPAGWFRAGGDPEALNPLPEQRVWLDGFVIRRFATTNRDYLAFLNDLVAQGRAEEALRHVPRERGGVRGQGGAMNYARRADGGFELTVDADGDAWDPEWPVLQIPWASAVAYAAWEATRSGLPWRLPGELEIEKAARGCDGRTFPWGNFLDPTWCCIGSSRASRPLPAPVGDFPEDLSPYGVRGLAGNMGTWCLDRFAVDGPIIEDGRYRLTEEPDPPPGVHRTVRGGSWHAAPRGARAASRAIGAAESFLSDVGLRLVRPWPVPA